MERTIESTLRESGDGAGALVWRQACGRLDQRLAVVIAARDGAVGGRVSDDLQGSGRVALQVLPLDPDEGEEAAATLGAEDALLGAHALVWATSVSAPMGARERHALSLLEAAGAPAVRAVLLTDTELLARISDHPDAELGEIRTRLEAIVPEGWMILDDQSLRGWVEELDHAALTAARKNEVGRHLLEDALARTDTLLGQTGAEIERLDALLAEEEEALADARREAERAAAHTLSSLRRRTEEVLVDLRKFLHQLDRDIPDQIASVDDVDVIRRVLPHWLDQVVAQWLGARLTEWRARVLTDLEDVRVAASTMSDVSLVSPSLHPPPVRSEAAWGKRLGITAAVGGGAVLAAFGLWIPGLVAAVGGLAWGAMGRDKLREATRSRLIDAARAALRRMGQGSEQVLRDQIAQYADELAILADRREEQVRDARSRQREHLQSRRQYHGARSDELSSARRTLTDSLQGLE